MCRVKLSFVLANQSTWKKQICQDNGKAMKKLAQSLMKLSAVHRLRQNFRMELKFTFPVRSQRFLQPSTKAEQLVSPRHLPECLLSRNATTLKQCRLREQPGRHSTPTGLCAPQVGFSPRNGELYNQCICSRCNNNVHSSGTWRKRRKGLISGWHRRLLPI